MARQSRQASEQGIQTIRKALKRNKQSQTWLANRLNCSRQTIWSLLNGKAIDCDYFMQACNELDLNWEDIVQFETPEPETPANDPVEMLVQTLRQQIQPYIQQRCGTMRVLNMTQPIGLGEIYTDVNILEKLTANRRLELDELLAVCRVESGKEFDRFGLGQIATERKPGLEVVQQHPHLMVLGRPGAGKTTFLKYLAIECISGNHFADRVPLFVTLKEFAEAPGQPDLISFLTTLLPNPGLTELLSAGKALVLLDGLDEVQETDIRRVNQQIRSFVERFHSNAIVVTCRIAAKSYTFEQFVEVEVADFKPEQIKIFVTKWFQAKQPQKAERFLERLKEHEPIQELATNPLLLTLLCLIFEEKNKFKESRADLYSEGVDLLLERWDDSRDIERDQIYKTLPIRRRNDLLSKLALATFETGSYFFRRRDAEDQICEYIRNLPTIETTPEALDINSRKILRSIEAQHGLLTERAVDIYSFSHLTFHEYFAALEITQNNRFDLLVKNTTEPRWREVFLLTTGMLRDADELVQLMKQKIDNLLARDERLQEFLTWVQQKSDSVDALHKPVVVRAFYFDLVRTSTLALTRTLALDFTFALDFALARGLARTRTVNIEIARDCPLDFDLALARALAPGLNLALIRDTNLDFSIERGFTAATTLNNLALVHSSDVKDSLTLAITPSIELKIKIDHLVDQLPKISSWESTDFFDKWWRENGENWTDQIRALIIEYRNIGHDWQFSQEDQKLLNQYYDANKLLIDCLNSDCYVSREVREEIEATLLLPMPPKSPKIGGL